MAGYIGSKAVSVNTTSATISDDLTVGDDLTVTDDATVGGTLGVTGVLTTTAATVSNGGGQFNGAINVGVDDTGYDVKFFGATASAYMQWDASADDLILGGAAKMGIGTTSPDTLLHLSGVDTAVIRLENSDSSLVADQLIGGLEFEKTDGSGAGVGVVGGVRMFSEGSIGQSTYLAFNSSSASTNNVEGFRLDSSGNLLVGQSSSTAVGAGNTTTGFSIRNDGGLYASRSSGPTITANANADGDIIKLYKSGTTVGSIQTGAGGYMHIKGGNNTFGSGIAFNNQTWNPTNASGTITDNHVKLGDSGSRFTNLYLSGGVYLGGTGAANKISDYETGNWTPVLTFGGANVGMTGTFIGKYIKVGNLLTVSGQLTLTDKGSSTGNVLVTGLPFTTGTTAVMSFTNYHLSYNSMIWGQIYANQFSMYEATTGGTRTNLDNTNFSADTSLSFSATYPLT